MLNSSSQCLSNYQNKENLYCTFCISKSTSMQNKNMNF